MPNVHNVSRHAVKFPTVGSIKASFFFLLLLLCCFQSGLIMACYHGYVDVVMALAQCPYIDVNWQDNEGNTALITAAQAGEQAAELFHCCSANCLCYYVAE